MTTLAMRMIKGNFVVTEPEVEPVKFKSRREARDWCAQAASRLAGGEVERSALDGGFSCPLQGRGSRVQTLIFILN